MSPEEKRSAMNELETAKREMTRCMGGVDPEGCVRVARRITELRLLLRDDAAMIEHLNVCLTTPLSVSKRKRSSRGNG